MEVLKTEAINLSLSGHKILDDVSVSIGKGSVCGLIGYNGAGKTTLFKVITGLNTKYSGKVYLFGQTACNKGCEKLGIVMDDIDPFPGSSVKSYFHKICEANGAFRIEGESPVTYSEQELLELVGMYEHRNKKIRELSLGMKQRLKIACALTGGTELLLLDEPFNAIDPQGKNVIELILRKLARSGCTVLVSSHEIGELIKLADDFLVMHKGRITASFASSELSETKQTKYVIRTKDASSVLTSLASRNGLLCQPSGPSEVYVCGISDDDEWSAICAEEGIDIADTHAALMNEEELLRWYMEGHKR